MLYACCGRPRADEADEISCPACLAGAGARRRIAAAEHFGLVTKAVGANSAEARHNPEALGSISDAIQILVTHEVFSPFGTVQEWSDVRHAVPDARVVKGHIILGIKHYETPELRKWKARLVAAGNNIRDAGGVAVSDDLDSTAPASLDEVRIATSLGMSLDRSVAMQLDVEAAYLHAPLSGKPYFIELPRSLGRPSGRRTGCAAPCCDSCVRSPASPRAGRFGTTSLPMPWRHGGGNVSWTRSMMSL